MISAKAHPKQALEVFGQKLRYVEMGSGPPIVFQHGNPTSSYLWRNIMPLLQDQGRCIALDLVGMGGSDKLPVAGPDSYTLAQHIDFFDAAMAALGVDTEVTLVLHDWGSAIGFDWARRHASSVKGIAYMEAIVRPVSWDEWPEGSRHVFQALRSEAGEAMILEKNLFIERILPASILRELTPAEMAVYRQPFLEAGEARRPTLTWPRQIPIDGQPADVVARVQAYADWLASSAVPKLFINADPAAILIGSQREFCRTWPNQEEVTVAGSHFIQEDSPDAIGQAIADWIRRIR